MVKRITSALLMVLLVAGTAGARKFYDDDPLEQTPTPRDAGNIKSRKLSDYYDFFQNMFFKPGERGAGTNQIPAQAVNTLGEAMDSAWYTKRHYWNPMSIEELVAGPGNRKPPSTDGPWTIIAAKGEGVTPGFTVRDTTGQKYVVKFDALEYAELSTSADVICSKIFHAVGYFVPENYIVHFTPDQLQLGDDVELRDALGQKRKMTRRDVIELLINVPRDKDGRFLGVASRYLEGRPIGPFRYYGTRSDDPNDVVPHEHRRDLRGLSVFCAWLAHDDSRSINTLNLVARYRGVRVVVHHLIDFGSTLGSATYGPNTPRSGSEYIFSWTPTVKQLVTLGLYVPKWARSEYPGIRSVGRFESEVFDAARWVAEYPNPAFTNRLPDDAFWAAKQVMAFTDEQIRAIARTGEYSDPRAEKYVADHLIVRRDKIGRAFFAQVLPLDKFAVRDGRLAFEDLAVKHGFIESRDYAIQWSSFNNETEEKTALAGETSLTVPKQVNDGGYLAVEIRAGDPDKTVTVYVRNRSGALKVVGIDRTW